MRHRPAFDFAKLIERWTRPRFKVILKEFRNLVFFMKIIRNRFLLGALSIVTICLSLAKSWAEDPASPKVPAPGIQHVDAKQAQKLVADKKVVVLDIRTPGEFNQGRIAGAKNIDFLAPDFEQRIGELDKNKSYLVHCASGGRSSRSLPLFKKHEFQSVYHLDGGIKAWEKAGLPVEK
jgi:rhodanese-related sulfurtransferase